MAHAVAPSLSVRLLGGFEVSAAEGQIDLPRSAQRVVAYLALQDRPVPRRRLAGVLWPDTTDGRAAANLRSALWRARKSVPLIRDHNSSLELRHDVDVDVRRLRQDAEEAMLTWVCEPPGGAALDLELLPGWYDEWVVAEREWFHHVILRGCISLVPRLVASGRALLAVDIGLLAVRLEPTAETAQQSLIRAYLAVGDRAGALRQYRQYAATLDEEFGLAPSGATAALVGGLLPGAPAPAFRSP